MDPKSCIKSIETAIENIKMTNGKVLFFELEIEMLSDCIQSIGILFSELICFENDVLMNYSWLFDAIYAKVAYISSFIENFTTTSFTQRLLQRLKQTQNMATISSLTDDIIRFQSQLIDAIASLKAKNPFEIALTGAKGCTALPSST